jgi:hypothetical protein
MFHGQINQNVSKLKVNIFNINTEFNMRRVSTVTTLEGMGFESLQGQEIFLVSRMSRLALALTQPPTQWVLKSLPIGKAATV